MEEGTLDRHTQIETDTHKDPSFLCNLSSICSLSHRMTSQRI
jgi:hypothetical protein